MKESSQFVARPRLKPYQIALCVLFVGWVPSLLLAYYSYSVLGRTLEGKVLDDAQTLVGSLAQHVGNELERTGETLDYYRTLPSTAGMFAVAPTPVPALAVPPAATAAPNASGGEGRGRRPVAFAAASAASAAHAAAPPGVTVLPAVALPSPPEWLASILYPQKRIDGVFLTDPEGKLLAAVPEIPDGRGGPAGPSKGGSFTAAPWKELLDRPGAMYRVSPVYARAADGRPVISVVATVRDKAGATAGYLGADILIERLGRRLHTTEMNIDNLQVVDANGHRIFDNSLQAAPTDRGDTDPALRRAFERLSKGYREIRGTLYFFAPIGQTGWNAVLARPAEQFYRPVRSLLWETALLVALLIGGTALAAFLLTGFYRRQLLSSLRVEQAQLFNEKILANMPLGIALIDPETERFTHVNGLFVDLATALAGLPRQSGVAQVPFDKVGLASREALARVLHFGVPFQAVEQRTTFADNQTRYLTTNLLRLQDSQQRTLGVLCLVEDTTAAVTLREELINANASKDQFLAQLSHELRNPLSPVLTMVAELEIFTDALPATRQPLEIIRRNVELEARLIDDLLDVTRISRGKLQLARHDLDVHRTLRLALEICQTDISEKKLRVELDLRAREHHAHADPARLQQIFWNLIKNAVKFTPEGRRITVRTVNLAAGASGAHMGQTAGGSSIDGSAFRETLRIDVIDEGIGIESQHLRRIFNAFDQGDSGVTRRYGGLGLGLAISKSLVEAHGGSLTVTSQGVGKGAVFTVELATVPTPARGEEALDEPAAEEQRVAPPLNGATNGEHRAVAATAMRGEGRSVLLVDDHLDTCLGMSRLLRRRGFQVAVAHSVAEALAQADGARFDLLISDIGLPDGTGFDLMNALRRRIDGPPGIALSGYGMETDIDKSKEAGFSEHLTKPVAIDRLDAAMRRLLLPEEGDGAAEVSPV